MASKDLILCTIDIGNTRSKIAQFRSGELIQFWQAETPALESRLSDIVRGFPAETLLRVGWISVSHKLPLAEWDCWHHFHRQPVFTVIEHTSQLPIRHRYQTPETLGTDRIVGIIAAQALSPDCPVLVIDAGTAITYDFADSEGVYLGGGIAPGIRMRFQALHAFTARLPLVESEEKIPLIGNSTHSSIRSGVVNGILAEVQGMIDQYHLLAGPSLRVFLTGGDIFTFENRLKKVNFADPYLLLKGIYFILNQNPAT